MAAVSQNLTEKPFNNIATEPSTVDHETNNYYTQNNNNNNYSNHKRSHRGSRRVTFFKNGDKYFSGKSVAITPSKYFSFKELMSDLNRSVDLPYGVRRVYTPVNGREIYNIDELEDGSSYVCASFEPFRHTKYGENKNKKVHPHRQDMNGSNAPPSTLPQLTYPSNHAQGSNQHSYYLPRQYAKKLPLATNNDGFVISSNSKPTGLPPISNPNLNKNSTGNAQSIASEIWSKPRLITIVRATEKPRKKISILLNRKGLHSFEQFVCDISDAFGLPQWKNDKIRKLYTIKGRRVQGISDFFRDDDMFVGAGKESLSPRLIQDLLDEVYQENPDYATAIFNEWETSRSRARPRYSSMDNNNHSTGASTDRQRESVNRLDLSPDGREKPGEDVDENDKTKRKKKVGENDNSVDIETFRQKERIKLSEVERKKRESNNNNVSDNNKHTAGSNKRVNNNIKASSKAPEQSDNLAPLKNDRKRKPRYKKYLADDTTDPAQSNPTPSSVSGIQIEDNPPSSRASQSRKFQTKSPGPINTTRDTPRESKQKSKLEDNTNNNHVPKIRDKSTHEKKSTPLPRVNTAQKSKSHIEQNRLIVNNQAVVPAITPTNNVPAVVNAGHTNEKPKLPTITAKQKTDIPNKLKRQISNASHVTEKYDIIKTLGDGNFAVVKHARLKNTDLEFAIKIIDKSKMKGKENMIENEIYIMKSCNHPNIVKLHEEFETKDEVYLVTDLVKGGDLFDSITQSVKFNEKDSSSMVRDLCEALFYLHSKNIVHRDLKPENLLVMRRKDDKITIKLADFGLAMEVKHSIYTVCGTPTYVAPEILSEIGYGLEVDMWACGVITYILLCGFPPFRSLDRNQDELFQYIQAGEFEYLMPYWDGISESSKDLINHLLVVDIKKRWKAEDVLIHPWILSQGNSKPLPNYEEVKKEHLSSLKAKAKQYAAEPFAPM